MADSLWFNTDKREGTVNNVSFLRNGVGIQYNVQNESVVANMQRVQSVSVLSLCKLQARSYLGSQRGGPTLNTCWVKFCYSCCG